MAVTDFLRKTLSSNVASLGRAFNFPEKNISESIWRNTAPPRTTVRAQTPANITPVSGVGQMGPAAGFKYNTTTSYTPPPISGGGGGGGGGGTGQVLGSQVTGQQNTGIQDQMNAGFDQVERDYQDFLTQLGGQEQGLRNQMPVSQGNIEAAYAPAKTEAERIGTEKTAALDTQATGVQNQKNLDLRSARDLFRQTQQANIAQLSGLGISSSSVAEALAENLGVETARRIAGVSQNAQDVINNIEKEKTNVVEYVKRRVADLEQDKAAKLADLQNQFVQGLNQINQARQLAANDKANRRQDLLMAAQQAQAAIAKGEQDFKQALAIWQNQTMGNLAKAASSDYISQLMEQNKTIASPQFLSLTQSANDAGYAPTVNFTGGKMSTSYAPKKLDPWEEELAQYGIQG